jgi:hypothetical protein
MDSSDQKLPSPVHSVNDSTSFLNSSMTFEQFMSKDQQPAGPGARIQLQVRMLPGEGEQPYLIGMMIGHCSYTFSLPIRVFACASAGPGHMHACLETQGWRCHCSH